MGRAYIINFFSFQRISHKRTVPRMMQQVTILSPSVRHSLIVDRFSDALANVEQTFITTQQVMPLGLALETFLTGQNIHLFDHE